MQLAAKGVYTNAAMNFKELLDSSAFKIWPTVLAVGLVIMWLCLAALMLRCVLRTCLSLA